VGVDLLARTLTAAILAVILIALASTSADASHSRGKCKKRGTTIAKNDSARVYERGSSLYACAWKRNVEEILDTELDDFYTTTTYGDPILRGRFVAWVQTSEDISCKADCPPNYDATTDLLNVYDIARGDGETTAADVVLGSLRLNSRGSAAWLEIAGSGTQNVQAWDFGQGSDRTLDTGPIKRLRLRGRVLSWLNADVPHSATLR
jgi:hypothetical protein